MKNDPKDLQIPLVLIVLGLIIYGIGGFNHAGAQGATAQVSRVLMTAGIWLGLLMWLFELEVFQAVIFTIVLISVNLLMGMGLRAVLS